MPLVDEIVSEDGRTLRVFDEAVSPLWHRRAYKFVKNSLFKLGWTDTEEIADSSNLYLHSHYNEQDLKHYDPFSGIVCNELKEALGAKQIAKCVVNLTHPTDTYFPHVHNGTTMLIYNNQRWHPEWAGETQFYSNDLSKVIYTAMPSPRRVALFDGEIPHSLRPHSVKAPQHRFTTAVMLDDFDR